MTADNRLGVWGDWGAGSVLDSGWAQEVKGCARWGRVREGIVGASQSSLGILGEQSLHPGVECYPGSFGPTTLSESQQVEADSATDQSSTGRDSQLATVTFISGELLY